MENLSKDIKTVLVTKEQIAAKVKELGAQIRKGCRTCRHSERGDAFPL